MIKIIQFKTHNTLKLTILSHAHILISAIEAGTTNKSNSKRTDLATESQCVNIAVDIVNVLVNVL